MWGALQSMFSRSSGGKGEADSKQGIEVVLETQQCSSCDCEEDMVAVSNKLSENISKFYGNASLEVHCNSENESYQLSDASESEPESANFDGSTNYPNADSVTKQHVPISRSISVQCDAPSLDTQSTECEPKWMTSRGIQCDLGRKDSATTVDSSVQTSFAPKCSICLNNSLSNEPSENNGKNDLLVTFESVQSIQNIPNKEQNKKEIVNEVTEVKRLSEIFNEGEKSSLFLSSNNREEISGIPCVDDQLLESESIGNGSENNFTEFKDDQSKNNKTLKTQLSSVISAGVKCEKSRNSTLPSKTGKTEFLKWFSECSSKSEETSYDGKDIFEDTEVRRNCSVLPVEESLKKADGQNFCDSGKTNRERTTHHCASENNVSDESNDQGVVLVPYSCSDSEDLSDSSYEDSRKEKPGKQREVAVRRSKNLHRQKKLLRSISNAELISVDAGTNDETAQSSFISSSVKKSSVFQQTSTLGIRIVEEGTYNVFTAETFDNASYKSVEAQIKDGDVPLQQKMLVKNCFVKLRRVNVDAGTYNSSERKMSLCVDSNHKSECTFSEMFDNELTRSDSVQTNMRARQLNRKLSEEHSHVALRRIEFNPDSTSDTLRIIPDSENIWNSRNDNEKDSICNRALDKIENRPRAESGVQTMKQKHKLLDRSCPVSQKKRKIHSKTNGTLVEKPVCLDIWDDSRDENSIYNGSDEIVNERANAQIATRYNIDQSHEHKKTRTQKNNFTIVESQFSSTVCADNSQNSIFDDMWAPASISSSKTHSDGRRAYSNEERNAIVDYIVMHKLYSGISGNTMWQQMEKAKICPTRTWQSLKEHFRKKILPNIEHYHLRPETTNIFVSLRK